MVSSTALKPFEHRSGQYFSEIELVAAADRQRRHYLKVYKYRSPDLVLGGLTSGDAGLSESVAFCETAVDGGTLPN